MRNAKQWVTQMSLQKKLNVSKVNVVNRVIKLGLATGSFLHVVAFHEFLLQFNFFSSMLGNILKLGKLGCQSSAL